MRRTWALGVGLVLLAGCGGGGGGGGGTPDPAYVPLGSKAVAPPGATYRAVFAFTGQVQATGAATLDVQGTWTLEGATGTLTSPTAGLVGTPLRSTIAVQVLGQPFEVAGVEYLWHDGAGRRWSLGYEGPDGERAWWSGTVAYLVPALGLVSDRFLLQEEEMEVGGQVFVLPTTAVAESDGSILYTRALDRRITGTQVLDTALGRYECYRVEVSDAVTPAGAGAVPVVVTSVRWERPDMGLLRVESDGLPFVPVDLPLDVADFEASITSYTE